MQINFPNQNCANQQPPNTNFQLRPNPTQPTFLTPHKQNQNIQNFPNFHHQQTERIMYKSTIQPTNISYNQPLAGSFGLGKLESMGRVIH